MHSKELKAKSNNQYYCHYQKNICMDNLDCDNCSHEEEFDVTELEV